MQLFILLCLVCIISVVATGYLLRKDLVGEDPAEKEKYRQFREEMELRDAFKSDEDYYKHGI